MTYSQGIRMLRLQRLWLEARQAVRDAAGDPMTFPNKEVLDALHGAAMDREIFGEMIGCTHIDQAEYAVYMGAT